MRAERRREGGRFCYSRCSQYVASGAELIPSYCNVALTAPEEQAGSPPARARSVAADFAKRKYVVLSDLSSSWTSCQADEWLGLGRVDRVGRVSGSSSAKKPLIPRSARNQLNTSSAECRVASSADNPLIVSQVRCLPPRLLPLKLQDALPLLQRCLPGSGNILPTAGPNHRSEHVLATPGLSKPQCTPPGL